MGIQRLIDSFSIPHLEDFLRSKMDSFRPDNEEDYLYYFEQEILDKYSKIDKVGEALVGDGDELLVFAAETTEPLTERTGKKNQYGIAKKILKTENKDAAIFIFYDKEGSFRFSFVRVNYQGSKRDFSTFKRYTYFVSPNLTNKTFKEQIGKSNFDSLDSLTSAFSVEPLNKQFYLAINTAFYKLIGGEVKIGRNTETFKAVLKLPDTPNAAENRRYYQEFAVRLIGRTIFCWFLKAKRSANNIPLIPDTWLSSEAVKKMKGEGSDYYHDLLQKLFFEILNKKKADRLDLLPEGADTVPFLNGGLFDPLEKQDFYELNKNDRLGISKYRGTLQVPSDWFIEFFEVLEQYNFTIDENSLNDAEVSIDPEMLGTIFENLLAEVNPETEKSARKSTGSYYTPREIVDYMVEQSLVEYLKTKIGDEYADELQKLFHEDIEVTFKPEIIEQVLEALSEVKILDPACGSGAFPMGALHKIIIALQKLDKGAVWWKEKQLEKIDNALLRKQQKEKFASSNSDYIRKLGVIQHSIYGVDIQSIATEISKLRSFLSLVIDENIDDNHPDGNRGILPLPNLEFKFVTANTLNGLEENTGLDFGGTENLQEELKRIRNEYLLAYGEEKLKLKEDFEKLQKQIVQQEANKGGVNKRSQQLAAWKPFGNESSGWFDPEWMFGFKMFDVIIGNPPYKEVSNKLEKKFFLSNYKDVLSGHYDLYIFFFKKCSDLLKEKGVLTLITPYTFTVYDQYENLRNFIFSKFLIVEISEKIDSVFNSAVVDTSISVLVKGSSVRSTFFTKYNFSNGGLHRDRLEILNKSEFQGFPFNLNNIKSMKILESLSENCFPLGQITHSSQGITVYAKVQGEKKNYFNDNVISEFSKPCLKGRNIHRYEFHWNNFYIEYGNWLWCSRDTVFFESPKIVLRQTASEIIATYLEPPFYFIDSVHSIIQENTDFDLKYILGIINSKLCNYMYKLIINESGRVFPQVRLSNLRKIPIKVASKEKQSEVISLVDKALVSDDPDKILNEIDSIVFNLYGIENEKSIESI
jgi:hypothetical protein